MRCGECGAERGYEWPDCEGRPELTAPATSAESWAEFVPQGYPLCRCPCHALEAREEGPRSGVSARGGGSEVLGPFEGIGDAVYAHLWAPLPQREP